MSVSTPVLGFAAYSGTGKTTLLEALLPKLIAQGLSIGVLKHAHHEFDVDKEGKDSYRLRKAGALQMQIASRNRHVLITETPDQEANFNHLLEKFEQQNLDLILVEGYKQLAFPKIELHRRALDKPWLYPHDSNIIAIASDDSSLDSHLPSLDINDLDAISDFIFDFAKEKYSLLSPLANGSNSAIVNDNPLNQSTSASCDSLSPAFLSVEDGLQKILASLVTPNIKENMALNELRNKVLAADVISPINVPAYRNSAMDGFAVRGQDVLDGVCEFELLGEIYAGQATMPHINAKQAIKIMTGAPMPQGADTVIVKEQVKAINSDDENRKIVSFNLNVSEFKLGQNVRQAGEDLAQHSIVFKAGTRIQSPHLGMLASLGLASTSVFSPLKVAIFSTGDEVQAPGELLSASCIYDSNRFTIMAQLERLGCETIDLGIIEDDESVLESKLLHASHHADVIISSGGVSVGDADFIKSVLEKIGQIDFWRINMRPGRPLAFGHIQHTPFFGLPGNPVAVMVSFLAFVEPALRKMQGEQNWQANYLYAKAESELFSRLGRTEFTRGIFSLDDRGQLTVKSTGKQGSGILRSMSEANCIILISPMVEKVKQGEIVKILPLEGRI